MNRRPNTHGLRRGGGRPKGRPNRVTTELRGAAQEYTVAALETLVTVMQTKKTSAMAKVAAAREILDRGHGKASQHLEVKDVSDLRTLNEADLKALARQLAIELGVAMADPT